MKRVKARLTYLLALSATALIFAASACTAEAPFPFTPMPTSTPTVGARALLSKQEVWQRLAIREYQFNLKWQEAGGPEHAATIQVENGIPAVLSGELPPGAPKTIDELFEWISEELKESSSWTTVHYDDQGFPLWGRFEPENGSPNQRHRFTIESMMFDEFAELRAELDEAKAKWESHGLSDYIFDIEVWHHHNYLGHPGPTRVVVENGAVSEYFLFYDPDRGVPWDSWGRTIDDLFGLVQRSMDNSGSYLSVEFDHEYGYPVRIITGSSADALNDRRVRYLVLSVSEGIDSIDAPPSAELRFPLEDWSWESRIVAPEEIERWKSVTDIDAMNPNSPVCAVQIPADESNERDTIIAFTGQCVLQHDSTLILTLTAPTQAPEGAVAHLELNGPVIWEKDGQSLPSLAEEGFLFFVQSMDVPLSQWDSQEITLTTWLSGPSEEVFEVRWELRDGETGETIPGSKGSQLFYIEVLGRDTR